ncbi:MAG: hypothetical protein ACTHU0_26340 [Kofleriaceae bacterium]
MEVEMADRTQRQIDEYELGPVEHVRDLDPDPQVGASREAKTKERILNPSEAGYFEIEGGSAAGLGAPLHLGPELKRDGGNLIDEYEAAYNAYAMPLRSALRAMGRVKDVSMTGAPMTPAELMQRPELAARFRRLSLSQGDAQQDLAFDAWSTEQTRMDLHIHRIGGGQHELAAAVADFRRVQMLLEQRRAEATKGAKSAEIKEIDETAETLARVITVSLEGWHALAEIETSIDRGMSLAPQAQGASAQGLPTGGINWQHGTVDDPTGASQPTQSKTQRAAGALQSMASVGGVAATLVKNARAQIAKAGKFELSLKDVLVVIGKDAEKYRGLRRDMAVLDAKIQKLDLHQEVELVRSAAERLTGFSMELIGRRLEIQADRVASRKGARTFAKTMGAGEDGIATMYAAEAYQELAAFGQVAAEQRKEMVDPLWGRVHGYLHGNDKHRYLAIGAAEDAVALDTNLRAVKEQRSYFDRELPRWQQLAGQWGVFLASRTHSSLITESNEADRASEAP